MRKILALVALAAFAAVAVSAWQWYFSDERAIRSRLAELADTLSVPDHPSDLARVTRLAGLRRYFAPDVRIRLGDQTVGSRDELLALVSRWTPPPGGTVVEFVDVQVTLDPDAGGAHVYMTAKVTGHDARTGEATIDAREANVTMAKGDGNWVVAAVESEDTLKKP